MPIAFKVERLFNERFKRRRCMMAWCGFGKGSQHFMG